MSRYRITVDYSTEYRIPGKHVVDQMQNHLSINHDRKQHTVTAIYADVKQAFEDVVRLLDGKQNVYFFQSTNITLDASCKWGRVKLEQINKQ